MGPERTSVEVDPVVLTVAPDRSRSVLLYFVLVSAVVAGCSGVPGLEGDSVDTSRDRGVSNALRSKLGTSAIAVFHRLERLVSVNVSDPTIRLVQLDPPDEDRSYPFLEVAVGPPGPLGSGSEPYVFYDYGDDRFNVREAALTDLSAEELERRLVERFTYRLVDEENWTAFPADDFVDHALISGATAYLEDSYAVRYLNESSGPEALPHERHAPMNTTGYDRFYDAPIYYGERFVSRRVDSPAGIPALFGGESSVTTTEELLQGTAEEPKPLAMNVTAGDLWQIRGEGYPGERLGELGTRTVLQDELNRSRALDAADGWANDRRALLRSFFENETRGIVWAHRWDTPAQADEFANAIERFLERRRAENDEISFRFVRPSGDVTVLIGGTNDFPSFVDVSYADHRVTVVVP